MKAHQQVTIEQKLTRARTQLVLRQPFFGALCLRLKMIPASVPTMATDGRRVVYSRAFVESLTPAEVEGVLAHEVMHCALAHHCRRGNRDHRVWNEAADLAINPILLENNFSLPEGALVEPEYYGLSAEAIYARLMQKNGGGASGQAAPRAGGSGGQTPEEPSPSDGSPGTAELRPGGFGEVMDATDDLGTPASPAEINYPAIARALRDIGYTGTVGLEAWALGDSAAALAAFRWAFAT